MAKIYAKTIASGTDKCLILDPKEALVYPFNLGEWTEIRVGIYHSLCSASDDNGMHVVESYTGEQFLWGLKDSSQKLPVTAGTIFWGQGYGPGSSVGINAAGATTTSVPLVMYDGSTLAAAGANTRGYNITQANPTGQSAYAYLTAWKFTIANRGLANQTVSINATGVAQSAVNQPDTTLARIRAYLSAIPGDQTLNGGVWNTGAGGVAKPIPDAVFLRCPFVNNRLRIHSILIERYA